MDEKHLPRFQSETSFFDSSIQRSVDRAWELAPRSSRNFQLIYFYVSSLDSIKPYSNQPRSQGPLSSYLENVLSR